MDELCVLITAVFAKNFKKLPTNSSNEPIFDSQTNNNLKGEIFMKTMIKTLVLLTLACPAFAEIDLSTRKTFRGVNNVIQSCPLEFKSIVLERRFEILQVSVFNGGSVNGKSLSTTKMFIGRFGTPMSPEDQIIATITLDQEVTVMGMDGITTKSNCKLETIQFK